MPKKTVTEKPRVVEMPKAQKLTKAQKEELIAQAEKQQAIQAEQQARAGEALDKINAICEEYGVNLVIQAPLLMQINQALPKAIQEAKITLAPKPVEQEQPELNK